ncbi:uncharacterized protein F54H12.2 [Trichonephila clavipes]|nr:uncharacterized protein F54H12.2 [Trichonephila clavipes]
MLGKGKPIKEKKTSKVSHSIESKEEEKDVIFLIRNRNGISFEGFSECAKSELNLFALPPTQTVIERGQWVQFHPIANVSDGGPIEFVISGSGEEYLDLSQTQLYDTAGRMNIYDEDDKDPNEGFNKRVSLFKNSATVDMMGRLHVDLFNQDRLLLNLVDLKIKLIRSKTEFCLMGDGDYKVVFDHISLFVRKVRVNPGVLIGHAKALEKATAKYPIDRVVCKVFSIPQSSYSFIQDNVFSGQMPKRLVLACVDSDAFNGNYKKSPFEFNHYYMNF